MLRLPKKIAALLSAAERRSALLLLVIVLLRGFVEMLGVASIAPFLAVAGNPELVKTNHYLALAYQWSEFQDIRHFLITLGVFSIAILLASAVYKSFAQYVMFRFANMRLHSISLRLFRNYLKQPYSFFLQHNSSKMTMNMLSEVGFVVEQVIMQSLTMLSGLCVSIFIVIMLTWVDPLLAVVVITSLSASYWLIHALTRKYIGNIGKLRNQANAKRFKTATETLGGIKELKVLGREQAYLKAFTVPSLAFSQYQAISSTILNLPRFLIEAIGFSSILAIAIFGLVKEGSSLGSVLPILGLYALGAQRLLPSLQMVFNAVSCIRYGGATLDQLLKDLQEPAGSCNTDSNDVGPLNVRHSIELQNVTFFYADTTVPAIDNLSVKIPASTSVGIIGSTGSGKTTLIDILLGLLEPASGNILVDGVRIDASNVRSWQKSMGYVPQTIFLADDSIASNIAFGIPDAEIDQALVEKAATLAQIHEFISSLPEKYQTHIGERGVRFSGGQRQRIGIARALYHDPDILILDEATSALDNETEAEVMKAIEALSGTKTIIVIAHRLTTVEKCHMLLELSHGKLVNITRKNSG